MFASRLFRILASRWPLVALAATAGASLGLASALWHTPAHEARVVARVAAPTVEPRPAAPAASATEFAQLLGSDRMLRQISTELGLAGDAGLRALRERRGDTAIPAELWLVGWLRQGLAIEAAEGSPTLRLSFRATDAALATRVVNALVSAPAPAAAVREAPPPAASLALQRHLVEATDRLARARLEADVALAEPAPATSARGRVPAADPARGAAVRNHREELSGLQRALEQAQRALEELARPAAAPAVAADPRASLVVLATALPLATPAQVTPWLRSAIGLLFGLFAGIVAALLIERMRQPVRDAADLVQAAGVPVLGVLGDADATHPPRPAGFVVPPLPEPPVLTRIVARPARGAGHA